MEAWPRAELLAELGWTRWVRGGAEPRQRAEGAARGRAVAAWRQRRGKQAQGMNAKNRQLVRFKGVRIIDPDAVTPTPQTRGSTATCPWVGAKICDATSRHVAILFKWVSVKICGIYPAT